MKIKYAFSLIFTAAAALLLTACGGSHSDNTATTSTNYIATSSTGDLVSYTINGPNLKADWQVTNSTGEIKFAWQLDATCGAEDPEFGYRTCTMNTSSCLDGVEICPQNLPGGDFEIMELPGVALFAHVPATLSQDINN